MGKTLDEVISSELAGDYACTRVWEAWQIGTMTQDDFVLLTETERVDELKQAILQWVADEVVGKDLPTVGSQNEAGHISPEDYEAAGANKKLYEQRQILEDHSWVSEEN